MKLWISKWALTEELIEVDAPPSSCGYVSFPKGGYTNYATKSQHHPTKEEAITRAEQMRANKIESLRKQIAKLQNLKFE